VEPDPPNEELEPPPDEPPNDEPELELDGGGGGGSIGVTCRVVCVALHQAQVVVHSSSPVLCCVAGMRVTVDDCSARRWHSLQSEYPDRQLLRRMTSRSGHPAVWHRHTS